MDRVLLFSLNNQNIKVTVGAYFADDGNLVVEGYDIGKTVEDYWGDSDYEYTTTVAAEELNKLYAALNVRNGARQELLIELQNRFNTNNCYSAFNSFLSENNIRSGGFSWT